MGQEVKLGDEVETVREFTYLGDRECWWMMLSCCDSQNMMLVGFV